MSAICVRKAIGYFTDNYMNTVSPVLSGCHVSCVRARVLLGKP